jgi:hypothetical protein
MLHCVSRVCVASVPRGGRSGLERFRESTAGTGAGRNQIADCVFRIEEALTLLIRNPQSPIYNFIVCREAASENMRAKHKEVSE